MPTSCVCLTVFSESSGINKKGAVIAAFLESAWCLQRVLSPQVSLNTIRMGKTQQVQYCPFGFPIIYGGNTLSFEWMALLHSYMDCVWYESQITETVSQLYILGLIIDHGS